MPTRNISLTTEQDAFIAQVVEAGEYQNASEAVRDALRALQQRRREDALKLKVLRAAIKLGLDSIDQGDVEQIEASEIGNYLRSLMASGRKRTR
jgi:antitoxin ParD1/3/4